MTFLGQQHWQEKVCVCGMGGISSTYELLIHFTDNCKFTFIDNIFLFNYTFL